MSGWVLRKALHQVRKVLHHYQSLGVLTVHPWKFPLPNSKFRYIQHWGWSQHVSRYYGQNLLLHDCLYRSRDLFNFTLFSDLDETIVPAEVRDPDGEKDPPLPRTLTLSVFWPGSLKMLQAGV